MIVQLYNPGKSLKDLINKYGISNQQ